MLEQAVAIDPNYGPALALAAMCHMGSSVTAGPKSRRHPAARVWISLDGRSRRARTIRASSPTPLSHWLYFGEDIGSMIGLVDRALTLNPSFARGWFVSGVLRVLAGQPDLAIEHVETSLRFSPRERIGCAPIRDR